MTAGLLLWEEGRGTVAGDGIARPVLASAAGDWPTNGLDALPLYDDIDGGFRAGMWTLAAAFVEVPDWANLADFVDRGPGNSVPSP